MAKGGIFGTFKTSNSLEVDGKWFEFPENDDGTIPRVRLARMSENNPRFQKAMEQFSKDFRRDIELDILTEDRAGPLFRKVFINTILSGWEDLQDADGNAIEYTAENADKLLVDVPDFYRVLRDEARRLSNYRAEVIEQLAGK